MGHLSSIDEIIEHVEANEIPQAVGKLKQLLADSRLFNDAVLQASRYNDLAAQIRRGTIGFEDACVEKNRIRMAILDLAKQHQGTASQDQWLQDELEKIAGRRPAVLHSGHGDNVIGTKNVFYQTSAKQLALLVVPLVLLTFWIVWRLTPHAGTTDPMAGLSEDSKDKIEFLEKVILVIEEAGTHAKNRDSTSFQKSLDQVSRFQTEVNIIWASEPQLVDPYLEFMLTLKRFAGRDGAITDEDVIAMAQNLQLTYRKAIKNLKHDSD